MQTLHDIPGAHQVLGFLPKLADQTTGFVAIPAPFKAKLRSVHVAAGENWVGVDDATDYNQLVVSTVVSASKAAVGTICGSAAGTPVPANTLTEAYGPTTYPTLDEGDMVIVEMGTVGAGTTAAPAFAVRALFEGA